MAALNRYDFQLAYYKVGLETGLVDKVEVIQWADEVVKREENPDFLFIELSLSRSKSVNDIIYLIGDYLTETVDSPIGSLFLGVLYHKFSQGEIPLKNVVWAISKIVLYEEERFHEKFPVAVKTEVYQMADAYDLAHERIVGTLDEVEKEVIDFLKKYERFRVNDQLK